MNITPLNNHQYNTPKFQALKIDKKLAPKLETAAPELLEQLNKLGSDLKDIRHFHVVLKDNLTPKIYAENKQLFGHKDYFYELKHDIEPVLGKAYTRTIGEDAYSGFHPEYPPAFKDFYQNKELTIEQYKKFTQLNPLDQAAEYSKLLDSKAIQLILDKKLAAKHKQAAEAATKLEEQNKRKEAVSNLINQFKLEEIDEITQPKKKWWQKLFS